jgi:pimeloyl-ACP methyl ester carboxylesterase
VWPAADVHDLIGALNYKQVNLHGVSYGTRLALATRRGEW